MATAFFLLPRRWAAILAGGLLLRVLLLALGAGPFLSTRIEVSTPANGALEVSEGAFLLAWASEIGASPYSGSSTGRIPPLVLWMHAWLLPPQPAIPKWEEEAESPPSPPLPSLGLLLNDLLLWVASVVISRLPQICADLLAAVMLRQIALLIAGGSSRPKGSPSQTMLIAGGGSRPKGSTTMLGDTASGMKRPRARPNLITGPDGLVALYLFNPFSVMSCVGGTTTPLESLCVVGAILAACHGRVAGAALALASGAYLGLQPLWLLVPISVLLAHGPERSVLDQDDQVKVPKGGIRDAAEASTTAKSLFAAPGSPTPGPMAGSGEERGGIRGGRRESRSALATFFRLASATASFILALTTASDAVLWVFPESQCLPKLWNRLLCVLPFLERWRDLGPTGGPGLDKGTCWATRVYGLHLFVEDGQPNIGQWWYFFAQVFQEQRLFFCFVVHALCGLLSLPFALRFPRRGLLQTVAQVGISTMLRPYPSVGDLGLYLSLMALLPRAHLTRVGNVLLMSNSLLLLCVLGPAMWHQWVEVESANANFFYSITLLLGVWHLMLLVQLILAASALEQAEAMRVQGEGRKPDNEPVGPGKDD